MLEKTPKTFNARFEKEVMWAIANLISHRYGRDKTEAVGRAILEAEGRLNGGSPFGTVSAESAVAAVGGAPAQSGFSITCRHCGEEGARGPTKFGTICFGCKKDGHSNLPAECPVCTAGVAA